MTTTRRPVRRGSARDSIDGSIDDSSGGSIGRSLHDAGRALLAAGMLGTALAGPSFAQCPIPAASFVPDPAFTSSFGIEDCRFLSRGANPFFVLRPGWQLVLESEDEKAVITVLRETRRVAGVKTRVVEELAFEKDGDEEILVERSLNFFAICRPSNNVVYFGEDVEFFDEDGNPTGSQGAWRAGLNGARPGIIMPGTILVGGGYYEEIAPEDSALDKGRILSMQDGCAAGSFEFEQPCVTISGENECDGGRDRKRYAAGVGVIADDELELTAFGFADDTDAERNSISRDRRRLATRP
jgi:hypothetical protein